MATLPQTTKLTPNLTDAQLKENITALQKQGVKNDVIQSYVNNYSKSGDGYALKGSPTKLPSSNSPFNPNKTLGSFVDPNKPQNTSIGLGGALSAVGQGITGTADALVSPIKSGLNTIKDETAGAFKSGVDQAKQGVQQIAGTPNTPPSGNPLDLISGVGKVGAGVIGAAFSPLAPVFKPVNKAVEYAADKLSDIPQVQQFSNTPAGQATARGAEDVANYSTIAGTVGGFMEAPKVPTQVRTSKLGTAIDTAGEFLKKDAGKTLEDVKSGASAIKNTLEERASAKQAKITSDIVAKREQELANIESNYSKLRKAQEFSKDNMAGSRKRVASTDVLVHSVDDNGTIRTKGPGGAVEQYKASTLDGTEGVVRNNLEREGRTVNLNDVQKILEDKVRNSGLKGSNLTSALKKVNSEIEGYRLNADANGNVPLTELHDAKVDLYNNTNYQTPPEVQTYNKKVAQGLKEIIENNSDVKVNVGGKEYNIKDINGEIGKYREDLKYLESLDGRKVKGGKLGKYFAQISGNAAGAMAGGIVGGFPGSALGTVVGGEVASKLKGSALQGTFGKELGLVPEKNPILQGAVDLANSPKEGMDINQYREFLSRQGTQSPQYNANPTTNPSIGISEPSLPQNKLKVNTLPKNETQIIKPADLGNKPLPKMIKVNDFQKDPRFPSYKSPDQINSGMANLEAKKQFGKSLDITSPKKTLPKGKMYGGVPDVEDLKFFAEKFGENGPALALEAKKYKTAEEFVKAQTNQEYRSTHQLELSDSITADKIDIPTLKEQIRTRNGYLNNYNLSDLKKLEKLQNNPEAEITIYRASPKNELNDGDWVTTDKTYANYIKKQNGGKVYSHTVKVKDLRFPKDGETLPSLSMASTFSYSPKASQLTDIWKEANKNSKLPKPK